MCGLGLRKRVSWGIRVVRGIGSEEYVAQTLAYRGKNQSELSPDLVSYSWGIYSVCSDEVHDGYIYERCKKVLIQPLSTG
jgi:hypothetical protein